MNSPELAPAPGDNTPIPYFVVDDEAFPDRLYEQDKALGIARTMTENARKYNRESVNSKANANEITVGSHVV